MTIAMTDLTQGILPANVVLGVQRVAESQSGNVATVTLTGDVTGSAQINQGVVTTIGPNAVTYAKMQTESAATLLGNPGGTKAVPSEITLGSGLGFAGSVLNLLMRNYFTGYTLSNDGVNPNTTLDIATGICANSTNAQMISLNGSITKAITSSWAVGNGNGGLGNSVSLTASTWYHVFAILLNTGATDIYFDTSIAAANAPTGTTAFRRIGSVLTDASSHILPFLQTGKYVNWVTGTLDVSAGSVSATPANVTLSIPPGVIVGVFVNVTVTTNGSVGGDAEIVVYQPGTSVTAAATSIGMFHSRCLGSGSFTQYGAGQAFVLSNTSSQIGVVGSAFASSTYTLGTTGWLDLSLGS